VRLSEKPSGARFVRLDMVNLVCEHNKIQARVLEEASVAKVIAPAIEATRSNALWTCRLLYDCFYQRPVVA
jgi:hypothetical protein